MTEAARYFVAMAWNNRWSNHRLMEACAAVDEDALRATRTSFFPSLSLTFNHLGLVDLFYIDALEGGSLGMAVFAQHDDPPPFAEIHARQVDLDCRLVAFCEKLDERGLGADVHVHRADHVQVERVDRLLLHLFQHQIHHRGQLHAMMAGTSVAPPQLDEFFPAADLPLRRAETAALGLDEDALWRG